MQHTPAKLGLRCVSAIAASILVTSSALAAGQLSFGKPRDQQLDAAISGMTVAALSPTMVGPGNAETNNTVNGFGPLPSGHSIVPADKTIVGIASFYDDPGETASGEQYDPNAFTAAAQLEIRDEFGGIGFGKNYRAAYGVAEYEGKKVILKFNDVGPLRPGRKFDLSRVAMAYFDGLEKGLLPDFKVTPLPLGRTYLAGPVTDEQLAALQLENDEAELAMAKVACIEDHSSDQLALLRTPSPSARPAKVHVRNSRLSRISRSAEPRRRGKGLRLNRAVGARVVSGASKMSVRHPNNKNSRTGIRISRL